MMNQSIVFVWIFLLFGTLTFSQDNNNSCKVLLESISGEYSGECKKGLAHGKGVAKGEDVYEGRFKKGFPHGLGKYTWSDGNYYEGRWKNGEKHGKGYLYNFSKKEKIYGIWKNDHFLREVEEKPYNIHRKIGIAGVSFHKNELLTPYRIQFEFQRDGVKTTIVDDLYINAINGQFYNSASFCGFENVIFPFEATIEFSAPNKFNTVMNQYELKIEITEPASWKVVIRY
ncbi:MAG TPA: hypothetical protein VJ896_04200 [Bacteroidales bacterium]|nr:hypothetical protein [Bacteroidales bacterium]